MQNHIAKHFALQLGSLASLYLSVAFFLVLIFGLINLIFPDAVESYWQAESAASSIRLGFAMVLIFFPSYLLLARTVNDSRRQSTDSQYLGLTKWLIYLSLLVGGGVLLGDLVAVVYAFLQGEITVRFILKALAVFAVTGAAFYYYIYDAQGRWVENETQSKWYAAAVTAVVAAVMVTSLFYIETPAEVREMRLDTQQVGDLQDMQWRLEAYYQSNDSLPADLGTLYGAFAVPTAPDGRADYRFAQKGEQTYELCATFAVDSNMAMNEFSRPVMSKNDTWDYKAGEWCFDREIDDAYRQ